VLGGMLEENFITSMIKSDGNLMAFVGRPIAATLAVVTVMVWIMPLVTAVLRKRRAQQIA
jgi:putative tricarboxylic transport membrane protein